MRKRKTRWLSVRIEPTEEKDFEKKMKAAGFDCMAPFVQWLIRNYEPPAKLKMSFQGGTD